AAAGRGAHQFCALLEHAGRPDALAVGTWRVRDVGAHLTGVSAYTAMLRGVPSPARSLEGIAAWNAANVASAPRLGCASPPAAAPPSCTRPASPGASARTTPASSTRPAATPLTN